MKCGNKKMQKSLQNYYIAFVKTHNKNKVLFTFVGGDFVKNKLRAVLFYTVFVILLLCVIFLNFVCQTGSLTYFFSGISVTLMIVALIQKLKGKSAYYGICTAFIMLFVAASYTGYPFLSFGDYIKESIMPAGGAITFLFVLVPVGMDAVKNIR